MKSRQSVTVSIVSIVAIVGASCGGSDSSDSSVPQITLLTTTTEVPPPTVDSVPETTDQPTSTDETDGPSTSDDEVKTTTTAPTNQPSTTPPVTTADIEERFTLTTSGLGTTAFGAEPEGAIAYVSTFLGQPTADTGWVDPFTIGPCGGTEIRQVSWGNLQLEFGDSSLIADGRRHFYAYTYGQEGSANVVPSGLSTPEDITVGSTVGALLAAYPNTQLLTADEFTPDTFVVNDDLRGRLSGLGDDDVVELIIGGLPCDG